MRLQDLPLDCVGKVLIHWPRPTFPHACRGLCRAFAMATRDVVLISAPSKIFWHELCLHAYFLAASCRRTAALTRVMDLVAFRTRHTDDDVDSAVEVVQAVARTARAAGHADAKIQGFVKFVNAIVKYTIERVMDRATKFASQRREADLVCRLSDDEYDNVRKVLDGTATFQTLLALARLWWLQNPDKDTRMSLSLFKGMARQSELVLARLTAAAAEREA